MLLDGGAAAVLLDDQLDPPARLFERLRQISSYMWDESKLPLHTTYDAWLVVGTRFTTPFSGSVASPFNTSSPASARLLSGKSSPSEPSHAGSYMEGIIERSVASPPIASVPIADNPLLEEPVLARISYHVLREERAFHLARSLVSSVDPRGEHIVKPLDLVRLPPLPGDRGAVLIAIYQYPGVNYIPKVLDLGPAYYKARRVGDALESHRKEYYQMEESMSLQTFLNFAVGATQCLELLHHGQGIIHGEIRGDTFHFNAETNKVRLISFGSGLRSFENGLTSAGWSALSKELGAKNKLLYISPEQTGRLPAEPDSRTDIYSFGVVLWMLLARQPVFEGETPLDIVQGVLGRRIPNPATIRTDVPDVLGRIIQKCTAKNVTDRYHSASGLRFDLVKVQEFFAAGDTLALKEYTIGSKDVSSFFMLPTKMFGRQREHEKIMKVIERAAKTHATLQKTTAASRVGDGFSSIPSEVMDGTEISSEAASSVDDTNRRSGSFTQTVSSDPPHLPRQQSKNGLQTSALSDTQTLSGETMSSSQSTHVGRPARPWERPAERHQSLTTETRSSVESVGGSMGSMGSMGGGEREASRHGATESTVSSLSRQVNSAKFRRRSHCEIVTIEGAAGLGKSCLVQSVVTEVRKRGYCTTAKFDTARRLAYGPLLKLLSSLFRQVWGERDTETPFHQALKQYVRPMWPMLHMLLGLPGFLLGSSDVPGAFGGVVVGGSVSRSISAAGSGSVNSSIRGGGSSRGVVVGGSGGGGGGGGSRRRGSSPSSSVSPLLPSAASQSSQDYLRSGSSTKTVRLMNAFLDVLRMFSTHKFICFCLDDLHFADTESLELIAQIISSRIRMTIIMTYRQDEMSAEKIQSIIQPSELDELARAAGPTVTRITLSPLTERDTLQYVSETLCQPENEALPLALAIHSKSGGNPFYMREMLGACHRKKSIWYDYRDSQWHYNTDRILEQFPGEKGQGYAALDSGFITRRLTELPAAARAILKWAALLGHSFSFELICHLLNAEFPNEAENGKGPGPQKSGGREDGAGQRGRMTYSQRDVITGLQAAIQAYILIPGDTEDRFRFSHDRYLHAAAALGEGDRANMHFIIAQSLLKFYPDEARLRDNTASHICESAAIIKARVHYRRPFRKLLFDGAHVATENSARPTATKYYSCAIDLLQQSDPWVDSGGGVCENGQNGENGENDTDGDTSDVSYDETLQLHLRAAECHLFMGTYDAASDLLASVLARARTAPDRAPAYVLQSRILSQKGDAEGALASLSQCLRGFGVRFDDAPTWKQCDNEFERLSVRIQTVDRTNTSNGTRGRTTTTNDKTSDERSANDGVQMQVQDGDDGDEDGKTGDRDGDGGRAENRVGQAHECGFEYGHAALDSIGAVLAETVSAAWWMDGVRYYHLVLLMVDIHLRCGAFPQSGMAFMHLATIALSRFNMAQFAIELGAMGLELQDRFWDPFSLARTRMIYASFLAHVQHPMAYVAAQADAAVEFASAAGDRSSAMLSIGLAALTKFFASENCVDVEAYCHYGCEEMPNWSHDMRGGTLVAATRQACRALQGKTRVRVADDVLTDDQFDSAAHKAWLARTTHDGSRPLLFYETIELVPLFLYGHYERAIEMGRRCLAHLDLLWSSRNSRLVLLFHGLALAGRLLRLLQDPRPQPNSAAETADVIRTLQGFRRKIAEWQAISDVNYLAWVRLLDAQMSELAGDHGAALTEYEEALDHAAEHDLLFEEALGNYLMAGLYIRRRARRSARACLRDTTALFRQLGAAGVAEWIEEEHNLLLMRLMRPECTADAAVQTDFAFATDAASVQFRTIDGEDVDDLGEAVGTAHHPSSHQLLNLPHRPNHQSQGQHTQYQHHHNNHHHNHHHHNHPNHSNHRGPNQPLNHQAIVDSGNNFSKGDRVGAWRGSMDAQAETGAGLPALDMIDLHAILVSSQVISSVLRVDELLKTMCDVILQTCGGSATLAAIVVQDEAEGNGALEEDNEDKSPGGGAVEMGASAANGVATTTAAAAAAAASSSSAPSKRPILPSAEISAQGWSLAASGDPERGATAHIPGLPLEGSAVVADNAVLYCIRFRESVFISDLVSDERFGAPSDGWLQRNPHSRAIIAIPICQGEKSLLGVLYLEGEPGSFTDRNVTVLQLLVNQIGISYSNALAMKNVQWVSAENRSMVAVQREALRKAREAEGKARDAENEAKRHVELAEEAAKAKSIFLANVSHELRTPLNGVIGNSELLRDSNLNRDQLEMADSIRVSADLLLTVINDILDFSKMEADKMKLYEIAFNPREMVQEVVRAVSYREREKTSTRNVRIVQDIRLPPMLIYGDPTRLHQVLRNLIGNSLKFTEVGQIIIGADLNMPPPIEGTKSEEKGGQEKNTDQDEREDEKEDEKEQENGANYYRRENEGDGQFENDGIDGKVGSDEKVENVDPDKDRKDGRGEEQDDKIERGDKDENDGKDGKDDQDVKIERGDKDENDEHVKNGLDDELESVDRESHDRATLTFWVEDTGIGIPPEQLANLFQPFSQADASTARKYGGSGLGLSICKSLIETMMNGEIHLESTEGRGTRAWFTVTFDKAHADATAGDAQNKASSPVGISSQEQPSHRLSQQDSSSQQWSSQQQQQQQQQPHSPSFPSPFPCLDLSDIPRSEIRICIAEDNPINMKIAIQYVQRLGYSHVEAYENGMRAVEGMRQRAAEGNPHHIILMDVQMPVLDGYEATKLIRKDPVEAVRKVLIIAMTASAIQGDREKCLAAGMNDYLAKPVRSEVLKRKLDAYIKPAANETPKTAPVTPPVAVEQSIGSPSTGNQSDDEPSCIESGSGDAVSWQLQQPDAKRQSRKLVKSCGNGEIGLDRPRGMLTKKAPSQKQMAPGLPNETGEPMTIRDSSSTKNGLTPG